MTEKTLIVLNPHAGSGRAGKLWSQIEPLLWDALGELVIAVTQRPEDVAAHLDQARAAGLTRVIAIGGDGTNHALINALMHLNESDPTGPRMTFGCLPIGTGHDWARTLGIPNSPEAAVRWIAAAQPTPLDVGRVQFTENGQEVTRHFLNIASAGIGGQVDKRVNRLQTRHPWTFLAATVQTLLTYSPQAMSVKIDGQNWYNGRSYIVAVANGCSFAHGMRIAPDAEYNDGLFDVVLVEGMPRARVLRALKTVYSGAHVRRSDVHVIRARTVEIELASTGAFGLDLDGEAAHGSRVRFEALPNALNTLAMAMR
jgi:YegS/Rv2252/BmrU family lipid kinase